MLDVLGLRRCLESVSAFMGGELGVSSVLSRIVALAAGTTPPVTMSSITANVDGVIMTAAATHPSLNVLDGLASPVFDAFLTGEVVGTEDVITASQWLEFSTVCQSLKIRSLVAVPLVAGSRTYGTMNLFSPQPASLHPDVVDPLLSVAALATAVLVYDDKESSTQRLITNLEQRVQRREEIEQAKGVLIATMRCSADQAADTLIEQSQRENRKIYEVARSIVGLASRTYDV